jgi:hypothetical protein
MLEEGSIGMMLQETELEACLQVELRQSEQHWATRKLQYTGRRLSWVVSFSQVELLREDQISQSDSCWQCIR